MQIPVLLDRGRSVPLTDQLIEQLRQAIRQARLAPGTRLPSSRELAQQLAISRNTVIRAYDTLVAEGYVASRPASGIFVCEPPTAVTTRNRDTQASSPKPSHMPMPPMPLRKPQQSEATAGRLSFDFLPGRVQPALFPLKNWRRLLQSVLSHGGAANVAQTGHVAGLASLRSAIASHLATARGIAADPTHIIITVGTQEAISIAARLFLNQRTLCAVEDPCLQSAAYAFEATGSELAAVPVDYEGLVPEELPARPTALLYTRPSHQFPTGHTLSLARRHAVIAWARRCGCYILEDDRGSDFRYEGATLPAIAALSPDCTMYVGSFSGTLGASLRLGYMVVPEQLADVATTAKALLNGGNAWLEQAALAEMMKSSSYAAHLARLRAHCRDNRDGLIGALKRNFGNVSLTGESAGLHVMWFLPPGVPDAAIVEQIARRARIGVYSLASAGTAFARDTPLSHRAVLLGYGGLTQKQIEQGIARLSDAIDDAVDDQKIEVGSLLHTIAMPAAAQSLTSGTARRLDPKHRRRPALPVRRATGAKSGHDRLRDAGSRMISVSRLYHYPVKGLSAQPLSSVALREAQPFPQDRIYALARPDAPIDPADPKWAKKGLFAMLMLDEGLARVTTHLDPETDWLTVRQGSQQTASAKLTDDAGRTEIERYLWQFLPEQKSPPMIVKSRGGHFMDKPDNVISLINLATVRSLEDQWGYAIDPLRFRANIYIDGARPWEEFDWVGGDIRIGGTLFAVDRKNGRCGATNVNPVTGRRDLDIPGSLRAAFGHKNLGVYLIARENGALTVGDPVDTPSQKSVPREPATAAFTVGKRSFICGGCYYVYEEAKGLPQQHLQPGTPFAAIPETWRCPDCGTDKTTFRPYVDRALAK